MRGTGGVVVVRTVSRESARALAAHVARRLRTGGFAAVVVRPLEGAPLFREAATRLGLGPLDCDPARAAEVVANATHNRRAAIVAPLPGAGTWDRTVAAEMALRPQPPLVIFFADAVDAAADVRGERFDVSSTLDGLERGRWWAALAEDAHRDMECSDTAALEAWWAKARRVDGFEDAEAVQLSKHGARLLGALGLLGRTWHVAHLAALGASDGELDELLRAGAVAVEHGFVSVEPAWDERATAEAARLDASVAGTVAAALVARNGDEPWAQARAAELLLTAGAPDAADRAHAGALSRAEDALVRRQIVSRWMHHVEALPREQQLTLRMRAAERALALGEADEAQRWAQSAVTLSPDEVEVTLLFGRAAVAMGDLVSAKVALERGRSRALTRDTAAVIAVELAEIAYLNSDFVTAAREANGAISTTQDVATRLKGRNVLGKILLSECKWEEAERHFAEDAWVASTHGDPTAELRARLNRGIALLSKGQMDEARAIFETVLVEGERIGDQRACAYALDNLAVVATWRHDYGGALALSERTLKLRQRLGDRLKTARILANLADLRRRLGLLEHAEHAIAFGRRMLGPGIPSEWAAHFNCVAARIALERGNTSEAQRAISKALADGESSNGHYLGEAARIAARIALEDGDLARANEMLARARSLASTDEGRAEVALLSALYARASGVRDVQAGHEALVLARALGEEELMREAHVLLAELYRAAADVETARGHVDQAMTIRDAVAEGLTHEVRAAFLARADVAALTRLQAALAEPVPAPDEDMPRSQRVASVAHVAHRELVGDDPAIRALLAAVRKVARSNSTVLIRGESGTGKELVADAIHRASDRANGPLVTVNCAALVETLLLSELFGHEKGAFTGAFARRRGRFELAEGGTLFLDEIGDISPRTQVALLRVLQERTFERVGGTTPIRANVRVICATHRDLRAMVERGEFREDLYYRLRGITLEVPALRQRMGDLPRISEHLLGRIAFERGEAPKTLTPDAVDLLTRHRWPGNVRELENALRAAALFADGDAITAAHLVENVEDLRTLAQSIGGGPRSTRTSFLPPPALPSLPPDSLAAGGDDDDDGEAPLPTGEAGATAAAYAQVRQGAVSLSDMKRQIERDCIARALAETKGNITRAAALLGMKRPRLSQLVKQYGLAAVSSEGT
jgi:transcriptional regulator with GAF, ATPase, and Fis domain